MSSAPLAGVRVVDLTRHLPGPLATRILADLGARVIKVEEPELGDPVRLAPPFQSGVSALASVLLAGHQSVALDLKKEPARQVLERLLESVDVLVESFRPGVLERFGLAPERLRIDYPGLIVASLSGWGGTGPRRQRSGHDLTYQALSGMLAAGGRMPAQPMADLLGAWSLVTAVLAALIERQSTGQGAAIDASLFDAARHGSLVAEAAEADGPKGVGEATGLAGSLPCYNLYPARDGRLVALAALEARFWKRLCEAIDRPDLVALQYRNDPESHRRVGEMVAGRSGEEWALLFAELDVPGEVVLSVAEAAATEQARDRGVVRRAADGTPRVAFPARIDGRVPAGSDEVPEIGRQTRQILEELGLPEARLRRGKLRSGGIGRRRSLKRRLWKFSASRR